MFKKYKNILLNILAGVLVVSGVILAGTITPPGATPVSTFYTLDDVYNKITDAGYSYSAHTLSPTVSTGVTTMYSLDEIYEAIPEYKTLSDATTTIEAGIYSTTTLSDIDPDLTAANIASGVVIFGITGTN